MADVRSYRDLAAWQRAIDVAELSYRLTQPFPQSELYGLTSQIRRAAVSIAANIAEGYGRQTPSAYINFLRIAQGSLKELETHLIIAERVRVMEKGGGDELLALCDEEGRILRALIRSLEESK